MGGAYLYVDHLRDTNEILRLNNVVQSVALDEMTKTAEARKRQLRIKETQVAKKQKQLSSLRERNLKLKGELNELPECLAMVPSDDFINKLRDYSRGTDSNQD
jgi:hypothetical protein